MLVFAGISTASEHYLKMASYHVTISINSLFSLEIVKFNNRETTDNISLQNSKRKLVMSYLSRTSILGRNLIKI